MISRIKKIDAPGILVVALLAITAISIINREFFYIYANYSLALYISFSIIGLIIAHKIPKNILTYILFASIYIILSLAVNGGGFGSALTLIAPLLFLSMVAQCKVDRYEKAIVVIAAFIVIYEFVYSFRYTTDFYYYSTYDINSNTVGMMSMLSMMLYSAFRRNSSNSTLRICILLTLSVVTQINCQSRGTLLATAFFAIFTLMPNKINIQKILPALATVIIVLGTIFPHAYLSLYNNQINLSILGKSLYTGREQIWLEMSRQVYSSPKTALLGIGSKVELWKNHELNVHNNYYSIIVNFGLIGFIIYFTFILKLIWQANRNNQSKYFTIMFISAALLLGFTETTTIWAPIFIFIYAPLGLQLGYTKNINLEKK